MILIFLCVQGLVDLFDQPRGPYLEPQDPPDKPGFPPGLPPAPHLLLEREQERWINRVSDRVRDHHYESLNLFTFQRVMVMMTSHHRLEDNGNGLDRVSDHILTHKGLRDRKYNP